jgi:hypothetical protein
MRLVDGVESGRLFGNLPECLPESLGRLAFSLGPTKALPTWLS